MDETEIEVPTEPIIDAEDRARILDLVRTQVNKTIDQVAEGDRIDAVDVVEAFIDLGILIGSIAAPAGFRAAITVLAPIVKPLILGPVERAVDAAQLPDKLLARADAAEDAADEHVADALALTETPEKEFFEKFRVQIHLRRAAYLRRKVLRLRARALEAQA